MPIFPSILSITRGSNGTNTHPISNRFCPQKAYLIFLAIVAVFHFQACKTLDLGKGKKAFNNIDEVIKGIKANNPDFQWLNGKLKMKVSSPSNNLSGSGNLKMKKDKLIWLSISPGLGLEVMRAKITPDSVLIMNRMEQTYKAAGFEKVNRFFPAKDITFSNLQNLLLGQPTFKVTPAYSMKTDTAKIRLSLEERVWKQIMTLGQGHLKMQNLHLVKPATNQSLDVDYTDYTKTGDYWLPGQLKMTAQTPEQMELEIRFKNFNFKNKDQAAFNIPSSYERTQ